MDSLWIDYYIANDESQHEIKKNILTLLLNMNVKAGALIFMNTVYYIMQKNLSRHLSNK